MKIESMAITTDTQQLSENNQKNFALTEFLEYRAIGRMGGRYVPSTEQIRQGQLITADSVIINVKGKRI